MGKSVVILVLLVVLVWGGLGSAQDNTADSLVECMVERIRQNATVDNEYGYSQRVLITKLDDSGSVKSRNERLYRTIWIGERAYPQLVQMEGRPLSPVERSREITRQINFTRLKKTRSGIQDELRKIHWWNLYRRFDFEIASPQPGKDVVLHFSPKPGKSRPATRIEKVLNQLRGTIRLDSACNVLSATATLDHTVAFGLGFLAKIHKLQIAYEQQKFESVWLPHQVDVSFSANFALLKKENQRLHVRWFDPYQRQRPAGIAPDTAGKR